MNVKGFGFGGKVLSHTHTKLTTDVPLKRCRRKGH